MASNFFSITAPRIGRNSLIDFSPINNALEDYGRRRERDMERARLAEAQQYQRGRDAMQDARQTQRDQMDAAERNRPKMMSVGGSLLSVGPNGSVREVYRAPKEETGTNTPQGRAALAQSLGLQPGTDQFNSYVMTGRLPREDQQSLTPTDKKAILEADEMVAANQGAIGALQDAQRLSPQANQGVGAGIRATLGNNLPDWMVPDVISSPESSAATTSLDNAITGTALAQLKTIFGGAPTEGERKILLDLQGSSSQPEAVRQDIYRRAVELANKRLEFNRQRAAQLRGGTYYTPQSQPAAAPAPVQAPAAAPAPVADPLNLFGK